MGSVIKHRAILSAAETLFLANGYLGTSMDLVADRSGVSKQTIYAHFGSKEQLFVDLITDMTSVPGDVLSPFDGLPTRSAHLGPYFTRHAAHELGAVMTPRLLQLRRVVTGEVNRFPELGRTLFDNGPGRSIRSLTTVITTLSATGLLTAKDPNLAATTFNWLVFAAPLNEVMLLGDIAIPPSRSLRQHASEATRVFLAAYRKVEL